MIQLLKSHWHDLPCEPPDFYGTDSRELFEHNLRVQPEDWIWRNKQVHYTINSQGYRCPEFETIDWSNSILMFGCSYVFAPGVDDSDTMASQLSLLINRPVINLGQGATDDLFQFANSNILYAAGVRPLAVIYLWPGIHRLSEFNDDKSVKNWGSWNCHLSDMAKHWITNETHVFEFLSYLSLSMRNMWDCPVLEYNPYLHNSGKPGLRQLNCFTADFKLITDEKWPTIKTWGHVADAARDYGLRGNYHPGPQTLKTWTHALLRDLIKINSLGLS